MMILFTLKKGRWICGEGIDRRLSVQGLKDNLREFRVDRAKKN